MEANELFSPPVIWFIIGAALLLLELAVPGLIIFFFGIGAWVVSLLLVFFDISLTWQILIFIVSSVAGLILLRRGLKNKFFSQVESRPDILDDEFTGYTATAETDLTPGKKGKVSFRGTQWNALSDMPVSKGAQVRIVSKESITLNVTKA